MSYQSFELSVEAGLARLTLAQPEAGNPFNAQFCAEFSQVANELAGIPQLRAVLLSAQGRFFSVGGDIRMFAQGLEQLPNSIREWTAGLHMGMARLRRLDAPIVVAVQGTAMGGGVALISNADLVYSARSAKFGAAYPQIGYSCDAGASFGLASRMGIARARRFMLFNEMLSAEQAAATGLVDFVVDDAALMETATQAALELSRGPTRAYGEIRRLINRALAQPFEAQLEDEAQGLARAAATLDAREGITAFVEKRPAQFTGQ
jgi:2-(1,2-epoxy-1,2-dihydrophenyl)acetyl-CoA isomerase